MPASYRHQKLLLLPAHDLQPPQLVKAALGGAVQLVKAALGGAVQLALLTSA